MYYYRNPNYRQNEGFASGFFPRTPIAIKYLLIINIAFFIVQIFSSKILPPHASLERYLGLVPSDFLDKLLIWQPLTYMFLHGGLGHIFINMFVLWMFGSEMERFWGTAKFIKYYFITGIGAALLTIAFTPSSIIPTIGASGAIYGILLAFGLTFPDRPVYLMLLLPVKAKHLVIFFVLLEFYFSIFYTAGVVAHLAHLGGMLFGYLYLKRVWRIQEFIAEIKWKLRRKKFKVMDDDWKDYYH